MKKLLLASLALVAGIFAVSANELTVTIAANDATWQKSGDNYTKTVDGFTFVVAKASSSSALIQPSNHIRVYQGATLTITAPSGDSMTKVTMTDVHSAATEIGHVTFSDGWTAFGSLTSSTKAEEFGATSNGESTMTMNAGKQVRISQIVIEYNASGVVKNDAELAFPETAYTVNLGKTFDAPALTKVTTAPATYTSSVEAVATVDATSGAVTIVGAGTTVITAKCAETDDYYSGLASYTLTVIDPRVIYESVKGTGFTFENPDGLAVWKQDSQYLKASAYISSATNAAEAYAVSPVIDLTEKVNVELVFTNYVNNFKLNGSNIPVADFEGAGYCTVVARQADATEWTPVAEITTPTSFSWTPYENEAVSLEAYKGTKMQFAFKYMSTADVAGTWEVNNIIVTADKTAGVEGVAIETVDENAPVEYYNIQGVRVANPTKGLYIQVKAGKATKVIL